jgi:hypothetical protein
MYSLPEKYLQNYTIDTLCWFYEQVLAESSKMLDNFVTTNYSMKVVRQIWKNSFDFMAPKAIKTIFTNL